MQPEPVLRDTKPPPADSKLKFWLSLIPIVTLVVAFLGGYGGSKYREGERAGEQAAIEKQLATQAEQLKLCVTKETYLEFLRVKERDDVRFEKELSDIRELRNRQR